MKLNASKEMESPRFRAILRATSGRRKRCPSDLKSYSHELNAQHLPTRRLRGLSSPEDLMNAVRLKFTKLKEEVDLELGIFAGDIVGLLESSVKEHQEWRVPLEDLLLVARKCAGMSPEDFWLNCERLVQNLDDRRQDLPMGILKQAHTRILFILTRCTRLLQFQKDDSYGEDLHILGMHQLSDIGVYPFQPCSGELGHKTTLSVKEIKERLLLRKMVESKHMGFIDFAKQPMEQSGENDSPSSRERMTSWKKLPSMAAKNQKKIHEGKFSPKVSECFKETSKIKVEVEKFKPTDHSDNLTHLVDSSLKLGSCTDVPQTPVDGKPTMICRICDLEIPTVHAKGHFTICTVTDKCDSKGLTLDQRLRLVTEVLARILTSFTVKSSDSKEISVDSARASMSSLTDYSEGPSPSQDSISSASQVDSTDLFFDGALTPASGSMTPLSPFLTPKCNREEILLIGNKTITEIESFQQIESLLNIARGIEGIQNSDESSLEDLRSYLDDLNAVIDTRMVDGLVVETFGRRIAKMLQEKFIYLCGQEDDVTKESSSTIDDDASCESSVNSQTSHLHGKIYKDRTSIEDFEIIKPISRGAYGRVFLAKKRITGDIFAIKVLKKADMIRKNAVESILAERNILISARNPFMGEPVLGYGVFEWRGSIFFVKKFGMFGGRHGKDVYR